MCCVTDESVEGRCREQFMIVNRVGRYADMPDEQYLESYRVMAESGMLTPDECTDVWDDMQDEYGKEIADREEEHNGQAFE